MSTCEYCKKKCNLSEHVVSDTVNTEVCEQLFKWLAKFKFATLYMSLARFMLFMFIMIDSHNATILSSGTFKKAQKKAEKKNKNKNSVKPCGKICCELPINMNAVGAFGRRVSNESKKATSKRTSSKTDTQ